MNRMSGNDAVFDIFKKLESLTELVGDRLQTSSYCLANKKDLDPDVLAELENTEMCFDWLYPELKALLDGFSDKIGPEFKGLKQRIEAKEYKGSPEFDEHEPDELCPTCGASMQATHHPLCQTRDGTPVKAKNDGEEDTDLQGELEAMEKEMERLKSIDTSKMDYMEINEITEQKGKLAFLSMDLRREIRRATP